MATPQSISMKLRASLGLDTTAAEQAVQGLAQQTQATLQAALDKPVVGTPKPSTDWTPGRAATGDFGPMQGKTATEQLRERARMEQVHQTPRERERMEQARSGERLSASQIARMRFTEQFGPGFSYVQKEKEARAMIAEQLKLVRDLSEAYTRLKSEGVSSSEERLKSAKRLRDEEAAHLQALRSELDEGVRKEKILGQMADDAAGGLLQGMTMQDAMRGGLISRIMSKAGGFIMKNPFMTGGLAVAGAGLWAMNAMSDGSELAKEYNIASLNVGRRLGRGRNMRDLTDSLGHLGYTPQQALGIADAYGMTGPAHPMSLTYQAIGTVAREAGFGENPEVVAGLARRATQLGIEPGAGQERFWAMMQRSMSEGVKSGVDKAERMKALFAMMEATAANTGTLSKEMVAGLAATTGMLSEGGRLLSGEKGAQTYMELMKSFEQPGSIAQEFLQLNAWKGMFGGRMPTAKELADRGLTEMKNPVTARRYAEKGEIEQGQLLNALVGTHPQLLTGFLGQINASAPGLGPQRMLFETALSHMPPAKREELARELGKIIDKHQGPGTVERMPQVGIYDLLQKALQSGKGVEAEVEKELKAKMPALGGLSEEEKIKRDAAQAELSASQAFLEATKNFQPAASEFKESVAKYFTPAAQGLNEFIKRLTPDVGKTTPAILDTAMLGPTGIVRRAVRNWLSDDESYKPLEPGWAMQSPGQTMGTLPPGAIPVVVSGEIALTGHGVPPGTTLDPQAVAKLAERQILEQAARQASMRPQHARAGKSVSP